MISMSRDEILIYLCEFHVNHPKASNVVISGDLWHTLFKGMHLEFLSVVNPVMDLYIMEGYFYRCRWWVPWDWFYKQPKRKIRWIEDRDISRQYIEEKVKL
jgi:hypothetical protein